MKNKFIFIGLFSFIIVGLAYSITMREIINARHMLEGAKAHKQALFENFIKLIKTFSLGDLLTQFEKINQKVNELKESAENSALTRMPEETLALYEGNQEAAEWVRLEFIAKHKTEINKIFFLLENILDNLEKETGQYKKELANTNEKISKLTKEIERLKKEIETLRNNSALKNLYEKMAKDSESLLKSLHELGKKMAEEESKDLQTLYDATDFITKTIKENVDPAIQKDLLEAQKERDQAFELLKEKMNQLPSADAKMLRKKIEMFNNVGLTLEILENGPKKTSEWDLKKVLGTTKPWEQKTTTATEKPTTPQATKVEKETAK